MVTRFAAMVTRFAEAVKLVAGKARAA